MEHFILPIKADKSFYEALGIDKHLRMLTSLM